MLRDGSPARLRCGSTRRRARSCRALQLHSRNTDEAEPASHSAWGRAAPVGLLMGRAAPWPPQPRATAHPAPCHSPPCPMLQPTLPHAAPRTAQQPAHGAGGQALPAHPPCVGSRKQLSHFSLKPGDIPSSDPATAGALGPSSCPQHSHRRLAPAWAAWPGHHSPSRASPPPSPQRPPCGLPRSQTCRNLEKSPSAGEFPCPTAAPRRQLAPWGWLLTAPPRGAPLGPGCWPQPLWAGRSRSSAARRAPSS